MKRTLRTAGLALLAAALVSLVALRVHTRRGGGRPPVTSFPPGAAARLLHVVDGDTAYFELDRGGWVKGRLAGINTPECEKVQVRLRSGRRSARCKKDDEFYGLAAYRALRKLLARGKLRLDCTRKADGSCRRGRHGRVLVTIRAAGVDVAEALARAGAAWTFTKYPSPDRARLCRAELAARRDKRGMWAAGPVPEVMAMMRARTRKWYGRHDRLCRKALRARGR